MDFKKSYTAYVFDLDHTLYDEHEYLFNAYSEISKYLGNCCDFDRDYVYSWLISTFKEKGRHLIFNDLLSHLKLNHEKLPFIISILRNTRTLSKMNLFPHMLEMLEDLALTNKQIYILTNGHPDQQRNKVRCINWSGTEQHINIYYANEYAPKPAPDGLVQILKENKLNPAEVVFIGDGKIDEACANAANVDFVFVQELALSNAESSL